MHGLIHIKVSLSPQQVDLEYYESEFSPSDIVERIEGLGFIVSQRNQIHASELDLAPSTRRVKSTIAIQGMTCASCVLGVENKLKEVKGVNPESVSVTLIPPRATLIHDEMIISGEDVAKVIEELGYDVGGTQSIPTNDPEFEKRGNKGKDVKSTILVGGMTCASCVAAIEAGLSTHPGVHSVTVNLLMQQVFI